MSITHILADGTVKTDITGHIVKQEEAPEFYELIRRVTTNEKQKSSIGSNLIP